jgi:CheY-like chemotaxis protein
MVELVLTKAGYRVVTAADGQDALDKIAAEMPGVILLDMKMPGMNGWQFASELQSRYAKRPPIVVLTAAHDAGQWAEQIGAEGFLDKPFEVDHLIRLVNRFLHREPVEQT